MNRALVLVLLGACASDDRDAYEKSVDHFIDIACGGECVMDEAGCRADVAADLAQARMMLDADGRAKCAACLDAKAAVIPDVQACIPSAEQEMQVDAICDLDPTMDYDRDGDSTDDDDEACAGFP